MPDVAGPEDPGNRPDGRVFPGAAGLIVDGVNTWSDDEPLRDAGAERVDALRRVLRATRW